MFKSFNSKKLDQAKKAVEDFCYREFNDFSKFDERYSDLRHISLATTTTEDELHEISFEINLLDLTWTQYLDSDVISTGNYDDLEEVIHELNVVDFDDLIAIDDKDLADNLNLLRDDYGNFHEIDKKERKR